MLRTVSISAIALFGISPAFGQVSTPPMTMPADMMKQVEPGVEIRQQGPIHEAFAQPGAETRGKGMTAPKEPPPQIEELPPETKPDGANVRWVPGYWSWDEQRKDFTWVSGLWRNTPDGRDWNPGKWNKQANGQYEYTPGFWRPGEVQQLSKGLPEPPKSLEAGPNGPAANADSIWIPGGWELYSGRYFWRPGYWATPNGDMVWEPSQYVLTDDGYSYVPGYWDYPLEQRGVLYAPVGFSRPLWQTPGWRFRPYYAIGVGYGGGYGYGGFYNSLYIGPGMNSYYFGGSGLGYGGYGYGGLGYSGIGIGLGGFGGLGFGLSAGIGFGYTPWYSSGIGYYNGLWNHYSWMNRSSPSWQNGIRNSYEARGYAGPGASHWATGSSNRAIVVSGANVGNFGRSSGSVVVNPSNLHLNGSQLNGSRNVIQPASSYMRELKSNYPQTQSRVVVNGTVNQGTTVHQFQGSSFSQPAFRTIGGSTTIMGSGPRVIYPSGGSSYGGQSGRVMGGFSGPATSGGFGGGRSGGPGGASGGHGGGHGGGGGHR